MKILVLSLSKGMISLGFLFVAITLSGQTPGTKKIENVSSSGREEFFICNSGCTQNYNLDIEYYWYNDYSGVKSTKGGNGGSLLHGVYKYFDSNGNLVQERNFKMGILHGVEKNWDEKGQISSEIRYQDGQTVYLRMKIESGEWMEFEGVMFQKGSIRRIYSPFMVLIQEMTWLSLNEVTFKEYFSNGRVESEYTTSFLFQDKRRGKYVSYYENGNLRVSGQFYEGDFLGLRDGEWKWYNSDGTLDIVELYKVEIEYWENGKYKSHGSWLWNSEQEAFMFSGLWTSYDENGKVTEEVQWR